MKITLFQVLSGVVTSQFGYAAYHTHSDISVPRPESFHDLPTNEVPIVNQLIDDFEINYTELLEERGML